jgi:hypothetical protein
MRKKRALEVVGVIGAFLGLHPGVSAQDLTGNGNAIERLKQQPSSETRRITVAPQETKQDATVSADLTKLREVQLLLEQVEENRGALNGTLMAAPALKGNIMLRRDLDKIRKSFPDIKASPFGSVRIMKSLSGNPAIAESPAKVEYKSNETPTAAERIVSIKSSDSIAANAFSSGRQPVTLSVPDAGLTASQVVSSDAEPIVRVQVGGRTQEIKSGGVGRFGNFDVHILASLNRSSKASYEGAPYVLRLQVMPLN